MEEAKIRDQAEDDAIDLEDKHKSGNEASQTKVSQLKRNHEYSVKIEDKWTSEAIEVTLIDKDDCQQLPLGLERRSTYSDLKNKKMMMFTILLPDEILVTGIKFNFSSVDAFKSMFRIHNIEAFSSITNK